MDDGIKTVDEVVDALHLTIETLGVEWEEYGKPDRLDVKTAVVMLQDELDKYDQPAAITLPTARVKVDKDEDGRYNVYFLVGTIDREVSE